jgi:CD109 antigen
LKNIFFAIQVPTQDGVTVSFWITATTIGQIPIEVKAVSPLAADAIRFPLLVKVFITVPQLFSIF